MSASPLYLYESLAEVTPLEVLKSCVNERPYDASDEPGSLFPLMLSAQPT